MASGPTQNYDDPTLVSWRPHPVLARALRITLALLPIAVAALTGLLAVQLLPPARVGLPPWLWLVLEVALCALLLVVVGRLTRRLLPLAALLRLTLVLPDQVPRRVAALRRPSAPDDLRARLEQASADGAGPDAVVLLELVGALARHDKATFRHSERVQGFATLIGTELGLGAADLARLGWAALLHDIGKLTVPVDVLNKPARPDAAEWAAISGHAAAGGELARPLARWLGPWAAAIDQHHERWDGAGYPRGLAGEQISPSARIVAVADAYDVITSARAYKTPLSADAARAELARCAGAQFDPAVVRAFLAISLGDLRRAAGPFALLGAIPALPVLQQGAARTFARSPGTVSTTSATAPGVATAVVVGAGLAVATPVLAVPPTAVADSATLPTGVGELGEAGEVGTEDGGARPGAPPGGTHAPDDGAPTGAIRPAPEDDGSPDAAPGDQVPGEDGTAGDLAEGDASEDSAGSEPGTTDGPTDGTAAPGPTNPTSPASPDEARPGPTLPPTASDPANEAVDSTGTRPPSSGAPGARGGQPAAE